MIFSIYFGRDIYDYWTNHKYNITDLFLLLIENASSKRELNQANEGLMMAYYANDDMENALPIATEMSKMFHYQNLKEIFMKQYTAIY